MFADAFSYLTQGANWLGGQGVLARVGEHLWYSFLAVIISAVIAIPLGLYIGHTGRGRALIVGVANVARALPSLGLMTLLILIIGIGLLPPVIALVVLGIPPLLAGAYAGVANVEAATKDAARAQGMTEWQVLTRTEIPLALPLILGGFRGAVLQIVATATIAAYVNLGGLGRYIFDGLALRDFALVTVGAILVTVLALVLDGILAFLVRISRPGSGVLNVRDREVLGAVQTKQEDEDKRQAQQLPQAA